MSTLYSSNFDSATVGALPSGWQAVSGIWAVQALNPVSGASNTVPNSSLGGAKSSTSMGTGIHNLFDIVSSAGAAAYNNVSATLTVKCDTAA